MDQRLKEILERLRASRFASLAGARAMAFIPVPEPLLNEIVRMSIPASAAVRDVAIQLLAGDRVRVRAQPPQLGFLPPLSLTLAIERQPEPPAAPLVLRILSVPRLISVATGTLSLNDRLPAGVRIADERVFVDLWSLLAARGYGDIVPLVRSLKIGTNDGVLNVEVALGV